MSQARPALINFKPIEELHELLEAPEAALAEAHCGLHQDIVLDKKTMVRLSNGLGSFLQVFGRDYGIYCPGLVSQKLCGID